MTDHTPLSAKAKNISSIGLLYGPCWYSKKDVRAAVEELKKRISEDYKGTEESFLIHIIDEVFGR